MQGYQQKKATHARSLDLAEKTSQKIKKVLSMPPFWEFVGQHTDFQQSPPQFRVSKVEDLKELDTLMSSEINCEMVHLMPRVIGWNSAKDGVPQFYDLITREVLPELAVKKQGEDDEEDEEEDEEEEDEEEDDEEEESSKSK